MDGKINRDPGSHGIADQRGFRYFDTAHETRQEFRQHAEVVIRERFIGLSETDLVRNNDTKVFRERTDVRTPAGPVATQAVQENDRRAVAFLAIEDIETEN